MAKPVVLIVHKDPVVHELVSGSLDDEFSFVSARGREHASASFAQHGPAVVLIDAELDPDSAANLVSELRGRDPHLSAIFFADAKDPSTAWALAAVGTVVPKGHDLDRLRIALRKAASLHAMSGGVQRLRDNATTTRPVKNAPPKRRDSTASTARLNYPPRPPSGTSPAVKDVSANEPHTRRKVDG